MFQIGWSLFDQVVLVHVVGDRKDVTFFNLLNNFKVGFDFLAIYFVLFILVLLFAFLLDELRRRSRFKCRKRIKFTRRFAMAVSSFGVKRLSAFGIFALFVHLFLWLTELFLTNNIKTNKVVVDTSFLIKNEQEIFSSRRVVCFLDKVCNLNLKKTKISKPNFFNQVPLTNMIATSPIRNTLWRIFHEKTLFQPDMKRERAIIGRDRCLLDTNPSLAQIVDSEKLSFVGEMRNALSPILAAASTFPGAVNKLFLTGPIYEYNLVVFYNPQKPRLGQT